MKNILQQNIEGVKIHGRILPSPISPKKPKVDYAKGKESFSHKFLVEKKKNDAMLKKYIEQSDDDEIEGNGNI